MMVHRKFIDILVQMCSGYNFLFVNNNYCAKISDGKPAEVVHAPPPQTTEYGTRVLRSRKIDIGSKGM